MENGTAVNPRPELTPQQATDLLERLYSVTPCMITSLPSYCDQNLCIVATNGSKYVLKIMNSLESKNSTLLEVQTLAMSFLQHSGVPAQMALPNTSGKLLSFEELDCGHERQTYCVRLLAYIPGKTIAESPVTKQDLYDVGQLAATLCKTMQKFDHPNLDILERIQRKCWDLGHVHLVEHCLSVLDGDPLREVIKGVIEEYKSYVLPKLSSFQTGITHGDLNDLNILVRPVENGRHEVSGIIDFSFLCKNCYVFEVAILIAYLMLENPCPLEVGGAVVAGWETVMLLSEDEKDCLFLLVLCRLCQSLVNGRYNAQKNPDNREYFLNTAKNGIRILTNLWKMGKKEVERIWFQDAPKYPTF